MSISVRERRLIVGFAFFAELVVGYFLLIDPDLTRLDRARREEASAREAIARLETSAKQPSVPAGVRASVPPALVPPVGDSFDLALERYLDEQIARAGATPEVIALPTPAPSTSPGPYRHARVSASGSYQAIATLVSRLGRPPYRLGLDTVDVRPDPNNPKRLHADLDVFIEPPTATPPPKRQG